MKHYCPLIPGQSFDFLEWCLAKPSFSCCLQIVVWGMLYFKLGLQTQFLLRVLHLNSDNCGAKQKPPQETAGLEWKECQLQRQTDWHFKQFSLDCK